MLCLGAGNSSRVAWAKALGFGDIIRQLLTKSLGHGAGIRWRGEDGVEKTELKLGVG